MNEGPLFGGTQIDCGTITFRDLFMVRDRCCKRSRILCVLQVGMTRVEHRLRSPTLGSAGLRFMPALSYTDRIPGEIQNLIFLPCYNHSACTFHN